jgi:hyperosmotically inducible periplasmic protein
MKNVHVRLLNQVFMLTMILFMTSGCNNKPSDEEIQTNVSKQLQEKDSYKGVSASVSERTVVLNGTCEGDNCAAEIEEKIKNVEGVEKVENNIQANNDTDLTLRTTVQNIISKYEGVQADVAGGIIVLRGTIDRNQVQALMNELEVLQAKEIDNQLAVQ